MPSNMDEMPIFVVYPGPVWGWAVACGGDTQSHMFTDKNVAINYARSWAEAHRPSLVRVESPDGRVEAEWKYSPFKGGNRLR